MNIESFKIFSDLAATSSFSQTAKLNGISQSAVSQQIRTLEKKIGAALINRTQKQLVLTPEGLLFQKRAKEIFGDYEKMLKELAGTKEMLSETIYVAALASVGMYALPPTLKRFMASNPRARVQLDFCDSKEIIRRVAQGSASVGITVADKKSKEDATPLFEQKLVAICSPRNPIANQRNTSLQELKTFPFLTFLEETMTRKIIDTAFRDAAIECVPERTFNNLEVLKTAVELNAGVALVPENTAQAEAERGTLRVLELRNTPPARSIIALTKKGFTLPPILQKFIAELKA